MGAYTWTFIKAEKMPKDMINKICDESINHINNIWYIKEANENFNKTLEKWCKNHDRDYDYYVNECNVPKEHMTHEYLKQELINKFTKSKNYINDLYLVKDNKLTLDEVLRKYKVWEQGGLGNPYCYYIKNIVYVKAPSEIFRLRKYCDFTVEDGIKTVNELIEYVKNSSINHELIWWENDNYNEGYSEEFENIVKKYYENLGDNNFLVNFG